MNEETDMYTGVGFALSSTVIGIIWAIIYKIVDIIFTARAINYIDEGLDIYEKNYHVDRAEATAPQNAPMNATFTGTGLEAYAPQQSRQEDSL